MYHCVTPSTSTMPMGYDAPRRQNYGVTRRLSSGEGTVIPSKRRRYNYYRLESESSHASGGDTETTESIYSHQGYETELVMDTPDTESKSELSDSDEDLEIEYEVQSLSENENAPVGSDSSSGAEVRFLAVAGAITAVICEPSLEPSLTDGEDSDNSSLAEIQIQRTNYDACMQCKLRNDNPLFRYCKKCFQMSSCPMPPPALKDCPRVAVDLKGELESFKTSNLKNADTHEKIVLPSAEDVAAEKTEKALIDGIEQFDQTTLKHTETHEKNLLPDNEVVQQEKLHQNLLDRVEHFDKSTMKHAMTTEKNVLPDPEVIQQEKGKQELFSGIENFDTSKLKHAETCEKNPLPTKEVIDQEKSA